MDSRSLADTVEPTDWLSMQREVADIERSRRWLQRSVMDVNGHCIDLVGLHMNIVH